MIDLDDLEQKAKAAMDETLPLIDRDRAAYQCRAIANPAAVLELVQRLRALDARNIELWEQVKNSDYKTERHRDDLQIALERLRAAEAVCEAMDERDVDTDDDETERLRDIQRRAVETKP